MDRLPYVRGAAKDRSSVEATTSQANTVRKNSKRKLVIALLLLSTSFGAYKRYNQGENTIVITENPETDILKTDTTTIEKEKNLQEEIDAIQDPVHKEIIQREFNKMQKWCNGKNSFTIKVQGKTITIYKKELLDILETYNSQQIRIVLNRHGIKGIKKHIETSLPILQKITKTLGINKLSPDKKIRAVIDLVKQKGNTMKYVSDTLTVAGNFEERDFLWTPAFSFINGTKGKGVGDCDDNTNLFLATAYASGIPRDDLYIIDGPGHIQSGVSGKQYQLNGDNFLHEGKKVIAIEPQFGDLTSDFKDPEIYNMAD